MRRPGDLLAFGMFILSVAAISLYLFSSFALAATSEDATVTASVTVNAFVDTSISGSTLSFGSLDPATSNNAATENPITFTNTANSNTAVDVYLNNSNMSFSTNVISFRNLTVSTENAAAGATDFNGTNWLNGSSANMGFIENLAVNTAKSLYFWQDVPAAQTAGTYGANVTIHAVKNGNAP